MKIKNEKGLMLLAMIPICLIIIGAGISLYVSQSRVLKPSTEAANSTSEAMAEEQLSIALSSISADYYLESSGDSTSLLDYCTKEKISEQLSDDYYNVEIKKSSSGLTITFKDYNGNKYTAEVTKYLTISSFEME